MAKIKANDTKQFTFRARCKFQGKTFERGQTYSLDREEYENLKVSCYPAKEG